MEANSHGVASVAIAERRQQDDKGVLPAARRVPRRWRSVQAGDPDTPHTSRPWLVMPVRNITIGVPCSVGDMSHHPVQMGYLDSPDSLAGFTQNA